MLKISIKQVNLTNNYCVYFDNIEIEYKTKGELFFALRREHGRCIGKLYTHGANKIQVGWIFLKKENHSDEPGKFLYETWVQIYN